MWKHDKYDGHGKCVYVDKSYYIGMWKQGLKDGPGKLVNAQGEVKEGLWMAD